MHRIYAGFLFAPLIVIVATCILSGGEGILLFLPMLAFAYAFTLVIAIPIFFLFKRLRWLQWWHATAVGLFISAIFIFFFIGGGNPYHFEIYGYGQALGFAAMGFSVGAVFWFIAIFRNEAFSYVPQHVPLALPVAGIFLLATALLLPNCYRTTDTQGEITAVLPAIQDKPMLQVKLQSGASVAVRSYCYGRYLPGRKVFVIHREKFLFITEGYWINGLADAKNPEELLDDCVDGKMSPIGRM